MGILPTKKPDARQLLEEIKNELVNYLRQGKINVNPFLEKLAINQKIQNIHQLLRYHFVLLPGIISFIRDLPVAIRRLKKSTQFSETRTLGQIHGRVNWQKTFYLNNAVYGNELVEFIVGEKKKDFDIPENRVLKQFLSEIINILEELKSNFEKETYSWLKDWFGSPVSSPHELNQYERFKKLFYKNIYLRRIPREEEQIPSDILRKVRQSRQKIYRDAAVYLEELYALKKEIPSPELLVDLLTETFITNEEEDTATLFELYWCIKIIQRFEGVTLAPYTKSQSIVAEWDHSFNGILYHFKLYHNDTAGFVFPHDIPTGELTEIHNSNQLKFIQKSMDVIEHWRNFKSKIFRKETIAKSGRPDFIIIGTPTGGNYLESGLIILGEVKYSSNPDYVISGLRQLLEYVEFIEDSKGSNINMFLKECYKQYQIRGILMSCPLDIENFDGYTIIEPNVDEKQKNAKLPYIAFCQFSKNQDFVKIIQHLFEIPPPVINN